jgi:hypothetical protein
MTCLPDYDGGGIANLMASLIAGLGGKQGDLPAASLLHPDELSAYRNVVLMVLDGLGDNLLQASKEAAWLNRHRRGRLTSVFPPTTATAITTYLTGEPPSRHGLTGWHMYFRELGSVVAVLPCRPRFGGATLGEAGVSVATLLNHVPLYDRLAVPSHVLSPAYIAGSDFNLAHLGGAALHAFESWQELLSQVSQLAREADSRRFIYGYWPKLDGLGHEQGIGSESVKEHLAMLDAGLSALAGELAGSGTLLIVTADHGQIDTTDADRIDLDDHPELARTLALPLCGESRAAYCYVRAGMEAAFENYVSDRLAHAAALHRSADLIAQGWFGPGAPHPRLHERAGDYVLVMKEHYVIKDWLPQERRHTLVGVHGGITADEMHVPLVTASL